MSELDPIAVARQEIATNEKLIWAARAGRAAAAWTRAAPALFGVPFLIFVLVWMGATSWAVHQATEERGIWFFPFFALPFLVIGLAFVLSPFWAAWRAGHTVYALTGERALIIALAPYRAVTSFEPGDMDTIEYSQRADGSGNVIFRHPMIPQYYGMGAWRLGRTSNLSTAPIGFYGIPEARKVADAVRALKAGKPPGPV